MARDFFRLLVILVLRHRSLINTKNGTISAAMDSFYDVTLFVDDKTIEAHQEVLRKASGYFAEAFDRFKSKGKKLVLPMMHENISYEDLFDVIKFIYTGEISDDRRETQEFQRALLVLEMRVQMFVKNLSGKTTTYVVNTADTVLSFKNKVREIEGIPPEKQRLIYAGHQLEDQLFLKDYNVAKGSTFHLSLRLGGGPCEVCSLYNKLKTISFINFAS